MKCGRVFSAVLVILLFVGCLSPVAANAIEMPPSELTQLEDMEPKKSNLLIVQEVFSSSVPFSLGTIDTTISAYSSVYASENLYLNANDIITLNFSYVPLSANVNFGLIAPDGLFYYVNVTNGSINQNIQVAERGYYTVAIENMSSYSVSVTGYVTS